MTRSLTTPGVFLSALGALVAPSIAQTLTQALGTPVTSVGLDTPVFVTSWPDNPDLLVVVERGGARVTLWDLAALDAGPTTVLDLGGDASTAQEAYTPTSTTKDSLGITAGAFHPKFHDARSGSQRDFSMRYNRVVTTEPGFGPTYRTFVKRYKIAPGKVNATTASATVVYTFPTQLTGHGHRKLVFGEDWSGKDRYLVAVDSTFPGVITDNGSIWKVLP